MSARNQRAKSTAGTSNKTSKLIGLNWRTALMAAGVAIVAPFFLRRIVALIQGGVENVSLGDVELAGKDSVRDVADDLGVGGVTGTLERGVDRVADRLTH